MPSGLGSLADPQPRAVTDESEILKIALFGCGILAKTGYNSIHPRGPELCPAAVIANG